MTDHLISELYPTSDLRVAQLEAMTPHEHWREAVRLMSIQTNPGNEVAILLRAQLHLQFAALGGGRRG